MRRAWLLFVVVLAAAVVASPALSQTKWVRGPVTAIGADSITVTVKGEATTFMVEPATKLIARGAGTAQRAAEKQGKPGMKLADFVKVGTNVEVHFKDAAGTKTATEIRPVMSGEEASAPEEKEPAAPASGSSVTGSVVSVANESVVVKADGKDMTFAVTPKTRVVGRGIGTKARELASAKKPAVVTEFLKVSDIVMVYFTEGGATPTATNIRLVERIAK